MSVIIARASNLCYKCVQRGTIASNLEQLHLAIEEKDICSQCVLRSGWFVEELNVQRYPRLQQYVVRYSPWHRGRRWLARWESLCDYLENPQRVILDGLLAFCILAMLMCCVFAAKKAGWM